MTLYKGFTFYFYDFVPRLYAWNTYLDMSFSICLTDIQVSFYTKLYGDYHQTLENTMKHWIDNYIENNNENNNT